MAALMGVPHAQQMAAVCVLMRAEALAGADQAVEALLGDLAEAVHAAEPDCRSYVVTRMMGSRSHFAVHARFGSWEAFDAHADTPHLMRTLPRLRPLLANTISMELFLEFLPLGRSVGIDDSRREIEAQSHRE